MPPAETNITVGLFYIAAFGFACSTAFLIWQWRQMRGLKDEILALVKADTERASKAIEHLTTMIAGVDGKTLLLNERQHQDELALANLRADVAREYMSKTSATQAIERVEKAVAEMKREVGGRLVEIEKSLRVGASP